MLKRIKYALCMAWQERQKLQQYRHDPLLQRRSVLEIDPLKLKAEGIASLAIDYDGVLATYGDVELSLDIGSWLNTCVKVFGKGKVFILTNNLTPKRLAYFSQNFNEINLISSLQKKPYPDGIINILQLTKLSEEKLLVVDDRLLTGILAAILAKTPALYITQPFVSLSKRPIPEFFFMSLRALERLFF